VSHLTEKVQVININDFFNTNDITHIDFLKIDAEVAEYEIFETIDKSFLSSCVDKMAIEFHEILNHDYKSVINQIKQCGFQCEEKKEGNNILVLAWKINKESQDVVRLNISCEESAKDGYANLSLYRGLVDNKIDISKLSYLDNSVDEIYSCHVLENFGKYEILPILQEWNRILKYRGKIVLDFSDFEFCLLNWVNASSENQIGPSMTSIFGVNTTKDGLHKTGFTQYSIEDFLKSSGFLNIKISSYLSNDQKCLLATAEKG
jgi:predicted SAM-dependent methyltransferase